MGTRLPLVEEVTIGDVRVFLRDGNWHIADPDGAAWPGQWPVSRLGDAVTVANNLNLYLYHKSTVIYVDPADADS